ncbi:GvpL/GvpF family gas vesicle protein [Methyloferula stellata]|uniref:GvpL/GvpF family gas vesicle protein n=1 Tax=Methyloferula stellata TaxID=876270 RepID=UPI001375850F|nr:GvpL/GvpF family gas vesicle protein [Methyloferula stellata]
MDEVEPLSRRDDRAHSSAFTSENVICLFAFAEHSHALEWRLPNIAIEQQLILHRVGRVAALVGVVPSTDYCGADAEHHLADVAWLAPRARRHAELVEWMAQWSAVFPAPFGTIYMGLPSLTAFMDAHEATIATFLRSVAGKEEWELRATAQFDDPETLDQLACSAWPDWRTLSKGARYMRLCRDKSAIFEFGRTQAAAFAHNFVAELGQFASDLKPLGLTCSADPRGSASLARYALLVDKANIAAIRERIHQIVPIASRQHLTMTLLGPWPPFSFRPDLK